MCHWKVVSVNWGRVKTPGSLLLPAEWPGHILGNQAVSHTALSPALTPPSESSTPGPHSPGGTALQGQRSRRIFSFVSGALGCQTPSLEHLDPRCAAEVTQEKAGRLWIQEAASCCNLISIFENNKVWLESIWSMLGGSWKWCHGSPRCYLTSPASRESIHAKANETKHMPWLPATKLWWGDKEENSSCVIIFKKYSFMKVQLAYNELCVFKVNRS